MSNVLNSPGVKPLYLFEQLPDQAVTDACSLHTDLFIVRKNTIEQSLSNRIMGVRHLTSPPTSLAASKNRFKNLKLAVNQKIDSYPFVALLATEYPRAGYDRPAFEDLKFWISTASLVLWHENPNKENWKSSIISACRAVRLLSKAKEAHVLKAFRGHTTRPQDIKTVATESAHLYAERYQHYRFDPIRVLLEYFLDESRPTRRQAKNQKTDAFVSKTDIYTQSPLFALDGEGQSIERLSIREHSLGDPYTKNPEQTQSKAVFLVKPSGTQDEQLIPALQRERAKATIFESQKRKMALPCLIGTPTKHDLHQLMQCLAILRDFQPGTLKDDKKAHVSAKGTGATSLKPGQFDWRHAALLFSSLITSELPWDLAAALAHSAARPADEGRNFTLGFEEGFCVLTRCFALPNHKIPARAKPLLLAGDTKKAQLILPYEVSAALHCIKTQALFEYLNKEDFEAYLKTLFNGTGPRQTFTRLRGVMYQYLTHKEAVNGTSVDHALTAHICGISQQNYNGLYYFSTKSSEVQAVFETAVEALATYETKEPLEDQSARSFTWPECRQDSFIGSKIRVDKNLIPKFYKAAQAELDDLGRQTLLDAVRFHNRYISLVYFSLALMTGHRPVCDAFERFDDFEPRSQLLCVSDKNVHRGSSERLIPVPTIFIKQWDEYINYLKMIKTGAFHDQGAIIKAIEDAMKSDGALFFFLEADADPNSRAVYDIVCKSLSPKALHKNMNKNVWPLPLNWNRHFARTNFDFQGTEFANIFMGHQDIGFEPFCNHSGLIFSEVMAHNRAALNTACKAYGIKAFKAGL